MLRVPTSPTASLESSTLPSPLPHNPVPKVSTGQSYSTCPKNPFSIYWNLLLEPWAVQDMVLFHWKLLNAVCFKPARVRVALKATLWRNQSWFRDVLSRNSATLKGWKQAGKYIVSLPHLFFFFRATIPAGNSAETTKDVHDFFYLQLTTHINGTNAMLARRCMMHMKANHTKCHIQP